MLADLERVGYLPRVWLAPEEVRELRRLVHYRQTLTKERKNLKLQIGATLREARQKAPANANPWTKAWLAWLDASAQLSPNARHISPAAGCDACRPCRRNSARWTSGWRRQTARTRWCRSC